MRPITREEYMANSNSDPPQVVAGQFPPTHWTVVVNAGKDSSPGAREAVGKLYRAYRPSLLAFLRRQGRGPVFRRHRTMRLTP